MKKFLVLFSFVAVVLTGCIKEPEFSNSSLGRQDKTEELEQIPEEELPLSEQGGAEIAQKHNEYGLAKAQAVYDSIARELGLEPVELVPTDLYVRFLVADTLDYENLICLPDSLLLFEFPLHLDLTEEQQEAFANDFSAGGIWFYATVDPDFDFEGKLPEVEYEILDYAYIQRLNDEGPQMPDDVWQAVLDALMGVTAEQKTRAGEFRPSATIKYELDHPVHKGEIIPLEGVPVRVWDGINNVGVYTNSRGETGDIAAKTGREFPNGVNYQINWFNPRWDIRKPLNNSYNFIKLWKPATTNGPKKSHQSWEKTFSGTGMETKFATAHKALMAYFYYSTFGERSFMTKDIPICSFSRIGVCVYDEIPTEYSGLYVYFPISGSRIQLLVKGEDNWEVEGCVYHELGHATWDSHIDGDILGYFRYDGIIKESYAEFISNCFMVREYPEHIQKYGGYYVAPCGAGKLENGDYTGIGEWLRCQGFSVKEIEKLMHGRYWATWRERAHGVNNAKGYTDAKIVDAIFDDKWNNWRFDVQELFTVPKTAFPGDVRVELFDLVAPKDIYAEFGAGNRRSYPTPNSYGLKFVSLSADGASQVTQGRYASGALKYRDFYYGYPGTDDIRYTVEFANGKRYTHTKTVNILMAEELTPVLEGYFESGSQSQSRAVFNVTNMKPGMTYEWVVNGRTLDKTIVNAGRIRLYRCKNAHEADHQHIVEGTEVDQYLATVKCRAFDDRGNATPWSNEAKVGISVAWENNPKTRRAKIN